MHAHTIASLTYPRVYLTGVGFSHNGTSFFMSSFALRASRACGEGGGCDDDSDGTLCHVASAERLAWQFRTMIDNATVAPHRLPSLVGSPSPFRCLPSTTFRHAVPSVPVKQWVRT